MKKNRLFLLLFCVSVVASSNRTDVDNLVIQINNETSFEDDFRDHALYVYVLHRLEKAVKVIRDIHQKNIFSTICAHNREGLCSMFEQTIEFKTKEIELCLQDIERTRNLKYFFPVWKEIQSDTKKLNIVILKDFSILILSIYTSVYEAAYKKNNQINEYQKSLALGAMALLFGNVTSLQAFELLRIIDKLTLQIPKLLEKYELTNSSLTWKQWLTKYWWLPPLAVSAITLQALFIYQVAIGKTKLPKFRSVKRLFSKEHKEA